MNWLLLRGLMREADHWGDFPKDLEAQKGVDRVVCLDLPGVGTESSRLFIPSIKQAVEDLRSRFKILQQDKGDEEWGILGISLGGMIAMQWAHDYPHDFKKIVVMNSSSKESPVWKRLTVPSIAVAFECFLEKDLVKREKKIIDMVSNLRKNDLKLIDSWIKIAQKNDFSKLTAANQITAASLFKLPKKINTPMLVLTSRADRMVSYECSKYISERFKAPIKIHPSAGHDIAIDDSKWVTEQIINWRQ